VIDGIGIAHRVGLDDLLGGHELEQRLQRAVTGRERVRSQAAILERDQERAQIISGRLLDEAAAPRPLRKRANASVPSSYVTMVAGERRATRIDSKNDARSSGQSSGTWAGSEAT